MLVGVGQRPTERRSWSVGAASGMGALYLKLYGLQFTGVSVSREAAEASVAVEQSKEEFCQGSTQAGLLAHIVGLQEWAP